MAKITVFGKYFPLHPLQSAPNDFRLSLMLTLAFNEFKVIDLSRVARGLLKSY